MKLHFDKSHSVVDLLLPLSLVIFPFVGEGGSNVFVALWASLRFLVLPYKSNLEWCLFSLFASQSYVFFFEPKYPFVSKISNYLVIMIGFVIARHDREGLNSRRMLWIFATLGCSLVVVALLRELFPIEAFYKYPPEAWILPLNRNPASFIISYSWISSGFLMAESLLSSRKHVSVKVLPAFCLRLAIFCINFYLLLDSHSRGALLLPVFATSLSLLFIYLGSKLEARRQNRERNQSIISAGKLSAVVISFVLLVVIPLTAYYGPQNPNRVRNMTSDVGRIKTAECYASLLLQKSEYLFTGIGQSKDRARRLCKSTTSKYANTQRIGLTSAHNLPVQSFAEHGLIGLAVVLAGYSFLLRRVFIMGLWRTVPSVMVRSGSSNILVDICLQSLLMAALASSLVYGHEVSGPMILKLMIGLIIGSSCKSVANDHENRTNLDWPEGTRS